MQMKVPERHLDTSHQSELPFHLGHHAPLPVSASGLIAEAGIEAQYMVSRSMIPKVRTDSRKLSPSTQNYDTDSRPVLEPPALALASVAGSRQDDVVFDNSRQPNFCLWLHPNVPDDRLQCLRSARKPAIAH